MYAVLTAMDQNMDQSWKILDRPFRLRDIQVELPPGIHLGDSATILIETQIMVAFIMKITNSAHQSCRMDDDSF